MKILRKKKEIELRDMMVRLPTLEDPMMKIPGRLCRSVCDSVASMGSSGFGSFRLPLLFPLLLLLLLTVSVLVGVNLWH